MTPDPVDVLGAGDPVAAVLRAHAEGLPISLTTSGTTARPRAVVRTVTSWVDSFGHVSHLTGIGPGARVWLSGPLTASMNLFAAVHARFCDAEVVGSPAGATHACLTPTALEGVLAGGIDVDGMHLIVAGDRLGRGIARDAVAAGARVSHYYGAAELSFVAWGNHEEDLRAFPGVEVEIRDGVIWVRSPYLSSGYRGADGPFRRGPDGFATVGDRGRLTAGVLSVSGRGGEGIVTAGATVLAGDVEEALRAVSGGEVVIVGIPHRRLGQLVAAVLTDEHRLAAARAAASSRLAPSHRPRRWFLAARWPVTAAGKVDRAALAELAGSGGLTPLPRASAAHEADE